MSTALLAVLVGVPVLVLASLAAFTYADAADVGMANPARWAAVVLFVPVFGFIVYLLARSEQFYDPETDPYAGGGYAVHPSRADDVRLDGSGGDDARSDDE